MVIPHRPTAYFGKYLKIFCRNPRRQKIEETASPEFLYGNLILLLKIKYGAIVSNDEHLDPLRRIIRIFTNFLYRQHN